MGLCILRHFHTWICSFSLAVWIFHTWTSQICLSLYWKMDKYQTWTFPIWSKFHAKMAIHAKEMQVSLQILVQNPIDAHPVESSVGR